MGISKEDGDIEAADQIIDPAVPSLSEGELPATISPAKIYTPEETLGVRRYSRVKFQTKPDYTPSMSGKQYETVNPQVNFEETLHPDTHMFLFQELIEEVTDAEKFIMTQLSLKIGIKQWKGNG